MRQMKPMRDADDPTIGGPSGVALDAPTLVPTLRESAEDFDMQALEHSALAGEYHPQSAKYAKHANRAERAMDRAAKLRSLAAALPGMIDAERRVKELEAERDSLKQTQTCTDCYRYCRELLARIAQLEARCSQVLRDVEALPRYSPYNGTDWMVGDSTRGPWLRRSAVLSTLEPMASPEPRSNACDCAYLYCGCESFSHDTSPEPRS